ncbi:MAG: hypothetical protein ABI367_01240 [Mucilaginibacter sp.]
MDSLANEPEKFDRQELLPNDAMQNLMTPSGWGGYGSYIFGGVGGSYPSVYTHKADLISSVGFCVGNSAKFVNVAASLNITKVRSLSDLSANFTISHKIFRASSISAGALQVLAPSQVSDAPAPTFFFAFSHSVQGIRSKTPGSSRLTYTIGIGSGRFYLKSPYDVLNGRGKYGTAVFGDVSYELIKHVNINAEWTGMNLGCSLGIRPFSGSALSIGAGVSDLTRYTSDKPSMMFSMGFPLSLNRRINKL